MTRINMPEGAGQATPEKRKPADEAGFQGQRTSDNGIVPQSDHERKAFMTLRATAARRGMGLYRIPAGYLLSWGSTFRELETLAEVEALLTRLGGSQ